MPSQLTYLKINEFRHVRPGSVIEFKPQFNVVVGRNGTGKTTLLNLISALLRHNFEEFVRESFSLEFEVCDGEVVLHGTLENKYADHQSEFSLSGRLSHAGRDVQFDSDESGCVFSEGDVEFETGSVVPRKSDREWAMDDPLAVLLHTAMKSPFALPGPSVSLAHTVQSPRRLDEGAETFSRLFSTGLGFMFIHHPSGDEPYGRALAFSVLPKSMFGRTTEFDTIILDGDTPPLARFVELSQYQDARLILVKHASTPQYSIFGKPLARFRRPDGNEIPHDQLSFGEKRLLAFLLELYANPHTAIVDELANGMHHSWLDACVELLEDFGTQAFLTSQNPLLLDAIPLSRETFASSHTLIVCELDDESGQMVWRNLTDAETEDFFLSFEVGLQHISEIMRDKGLW